MARNYKNVRGKTKTYNTKKKVNKLAKNVRILMKSVEHKQLDVTNTALVIVDGVGTLVGLNNIVIGDTNITRDGNQIMAASIYIKLIFHIHPSASSSQIRCLLVKDKQVNNSNFTTPTLLENSTNILSIISPRNLDNMRRFTVLYDKIIILNQNITSVSSTARHIKIWKKLNMIIRYDGNAGNINDVTENGLSLLFIGNEATNTPTVDLFSRVLFTDN